MNCTSYQRKPAFTLLELLIVTVIIGLLTSVAVVSVNKLGQSSRDARRKSDLSDISWAVERYYSQNRSYPSTNTQPGFTKWAGWGPDTGYPALCTSCQKKIGAYVPSVVGIFIARLPKDPRFLPTENSGGYMYESLGDNYKVWAYATVESTNDIPTDDPFRDSEECITKDSNRKISYQISTAGAYAYDNCNTYY